MIIDLTDLDDGATLEADVAVVGAGFAGIDLARRLGAAGLRVLLLESGRRDFDPEIQALGRVDSVGKAVRRPSPDSPFTPYLPKIFRGEFRVRQLGGTSNIWTGKWRAFDELDFAARPWVPGSGWPITRADLAPYYAEVARDHGLADVDAFTELAAVRAAAERLAAAGLELSFHYWQARPARPGRDHRDELERSEAVQVVLGANATELRLDDTHDAVHELVVRALDGRTARVRAEQFVLSMGGLEAARLLLASNRQVPAGVGNGEGLVGRFHMDHPKSKDARLHPGPALRSLAPWTLVEPLPRFHASVALSDEVQRDAQTLDHAVYLSPVRRHLVDYPDREVTALKTAIRRRRPREAAAAARSLLRRPSAARKVALRTWYGDHAGPVAHYRASMYVEQAPNRDSRVVLADDVDAVGMPRLVIDWQLDDLDRRSFHVALRELAERLERAGIGTLDLGPDEPSLDDWVDAAHHIGATRMGRTPQEGVVDAACRVFGTANLYIASSSVFPTGHSAAPTMTILALTRRLAQHLLEMRGAAPPTRP